MQLPHLRLETLDAPPSSALTLLFGCQQRHQTSVKHPASVIPVGFPIGKHFVELSLHATDRIVELPINLVNQLILCKLLAS